MSKSTTASTTVERRPARTPAEWDELALGTIVPLLQQGVPMTAIRKGGHPLCEHGFGAGPTIRKALRRVGYDTKGQEFNMPTVKANGAALRQRVIAMRAELRSWDFIAQATGKDADELRAMVAATKPELAAGRVTRVVANQVRADLKPARKARKAKAAA